MIETLKGWGVLGRDQRAVNDGMIPERRLRLEIGADLPEPSLSCVLPLQDARSFDLEEREKLTQINA